MAIQWDAAGYSGSAAKYKMDRYRIDTRQGYDTGYQGYGEIQAGYR